jgi:hypothetical protein
MSGISSNITGEYILSNKFMHIRGIIPFSSPYPIMEYDFPEPVCPYAKMQVLYPSNE